MNPKEKENCHIVTYVTEHIEANLEWITDALTTYRELKRIGKRTSLHLKTNIQEE